jgi:hypothetical protein
VVGQDAEILDFLSDLAGDGLIVQNRSLVYQPRKSRGVVFDLGKVNI